MLRNIRVILFANRLLLRLRNRSIDVSTFAISDINLSENLIEMSKQLIVSSITNLFYLNLEAINRIRIWISIESILLVWKPVLPLSLSGI